MFPEYKNYIPRKIGCIYCTDLGIFHLAIRHDYHTGFLFAEELNTAVAQLTNAYNYLNNDLVGPLSYVLEGQSLSLPPFPQIHHHATGVIVKPSPIAGYKKLININNNPPSLNALSHSLTEDLNIGNDELILKKIDRLQYSKHPIFYEFFYFLDVGWETVSQSYSEQYLQEMPERSSLKDKCDFFDSSKFEALFKDEQFLMECVFKLIEQFKTKPESTLYGPGFGLQLVLKGKIEILAYILNDKLHAFDAIFLKFILPFIITACINWVDEDFYFNPLLSQLDTLSDSNYKHHIRPELLTPLYQKLINTYHIMFITTGSFSKSCQVHFFPKASQSWRDDLSNEEVAKIEESHRTFQFTWGGSFNYFLDPLMVYLIKLFIQAPNGKLVKHKGRIGPILRTMFPGKNLDLLTLPLNETETRSATLLLTSSEENALTLSLQAYHLTPLSPFQTFIINGMHLFIEGFLQINPKLVSKDRAIYQGSHDGYHMSALGMNANTGADQENAFRSVSRLWEGIFGFRRHFHPTYQSIENAPYCHVSLPYGESALHLTPNTSVIKQDKSGLHFYPLAIEDKGLYCHLNVGANISVSEVDDTQYIASGCCLLGNDLVATVSTPEGNKPYHLLDTHEEVPEGSIVDVSFQNQEHPEEVMSLAIQKTLAPFYRNAYKHKKIIFCYHDLRMDYLFYLLPHYIKGSLSRELLMQAVAFIDERHHQMVSKLTTILAPHQIECVALSALTSLSLDNLLQQIDSLKQNSETCQIESALVSYILQFMVSDASVPAHAKQVYEYILTNQDALEKLLKQKGLHFIPVVDYVAQFALINLRAKSPVLASIPSVEYKLLHNYERSFAQVFGSVIHFLWMNPITIRNDKQHNRLFFIDKDIPQYCALIDVAAVPLQRMVHHQALDNPQEVVKEWNELKSTLSRFPAFFAQSNGENGSTILLKDSNDNNNTVENTVTIDQAKV